MRPLRGMLMAALVAAPGCNSQRATAEQCRAIFERLVVLELQEMGFADPVLERRRRAVLVGRHSREIQSCVGRRIPPRAMDCVASAASAEVLSHDCLR